MSSNSNPYVSSVPKLSLRLASTTECKSTELKYYDALHGSTVLSTSFVVLHPNSITSGTGVSNRVGRAIRILAASISGWLSPSDASNLARIVVANNVAGFVASPNITVGNTHYGGLLCADTKINFYSDSLIGFPPESYSGATTYPTVPFTKTIKFGKQGLLVRYDASNNISSNFPYVGMISDSTLAGHPVFLGNVRFYFTDA